MQVRVQNKGKSVWKSRYVGDVSLTEDPTTPQLTKMMVPAPYQPPKKKAKKKKIKVSRR